MAKKDKESGIYRPIVKKYVFPSFEALLDFLELFIDDRHVVRLAPGIWPRLARIVFELHLGKVDPPNVSRHLVDDVITDRIVYRALPPVGIVGLVFHLDHWWATCSEWVVACQRDDCPREELYGGGMNDSAKFFRCSVNAVDRPP